MNALSLNWRVAPTIHWLEAWATSLRLDYTKRGGGELAEKSLAAYLISARHFCRSGTGDLVDLLNERHVTEYFAAQQRTKTPAKTINHRLTTVRKIVAWATQNGLIEADPTRRIERVREMRLPRRARTADEIARIETAAILGTQLGGTQTSPWLGERDYLIWMLFKNTTLRIDMVRKLDLDDVMLTDAPILRVIGKGNVHGEVPISDELRGALEHWFTVRGTAGTALVCDRHGQRLSTSQIRRRLEAMGQAAGVHIKPHDMRHTRIHQIVQWLLQSGMPLEAALHVAQTLALHQSASTTLGYLRASMEDLVLVNNMAGAVPNL